MLEKNFKNPLKMDGDTLTVIISKFTLLKKRIKTSSINHPQSTLKESIGKLASEHFDSYEAIYSCLMYIIWAISLWFVLSWVTRIVCKLFFPVVACFAFLVSFAWILLIFNGICTAFITGNFQWTAFCGFTDGIEDLQLYLL